MGQCFPIYSIACPEAPQKRSQADTGYGDDTAGIMLALLVPKSLLRNMYNIVMTVSDMLNIQIDSAFHFDEKNLSRQ